MKTLYILCVVLVLSSFPIKSAFAGQVVNTHSQRKPEQTKVSNDDDDLDKDEEQIYSYSPFGSEGTHCAVYDPYSKINRKMFVFNVMLDYLILRRVATFYDKVTNDYTKARVWSFLDNISTPITTVNYILQLNFQGAVESFWRFLINSTFGVAGLFDISNKAGLRPTSQNFGSTLAHYGVAPGPHLVLPFFGQTNFRDFLGLTFLDGALNPLKYKIPSNVRLGMTITKMIHLRASILPFTNYIKDNSVDPYVTVRDATHQSRESAIQYPATFVCPVERKMETSSPIK